YGIAIDATGNAYITGSTASTNFPTSTGAYRTSMQGGNFDAFVTKLNAAGTAVVYSTYLGGNGDDFGYGITVSGTNAYITGATKSSNYPTTASTYQGSYGGGLSDAFVTELNTAGNGLVYSTYLGGTGEDTGVAIAVDASGNAYVAGST